LLDSIQIGANFGPPNRPVYRSDRMNTWESFFREKSRRRYRSREIIIKRVILFVLFGSLATAVYLSVAGLPR
jgi:hypothetical protein